MARPPFVKTYTPEEHELFARYRPQREKHAPTTCNEGEVCWVKEGLPAMGKSHHCLGCRGYPRVGTWRERRFTQYPNRF